MKTAPNSVQWLLSIVNAKPAADEQDDLAHVDLAVDAVHRRRSRATATNPTMTPMKMMTAGSNKACEVLHLELELAVVKGGRGLELLVECPGLFPDPEHLASGGRKEPGFGQRLGQARCPPSSALGCG